MVKQPEYKVKLGREREQLRKERAAIKKNVVNYDARCVPFLEKIFESWLHLAKLLRK